MKIQNNNSNNNNNNKTAGNNSNNRKASPHGRGNTSRTNNMRPDNLRTGGSRTGGKPSVKDSKVGKSNSVWSEGITKSERRAANRKSSDAIYLKPRLAKFDIPFFGILVMLMAFGLVMLFTASTSIGFREHSDSFHYIQSQVFFMAVGFAAMLFCSFFDYKHLAKKRVAFTVFFGALAMLIMVLTPLGVVQGGARRWLGFGITFQPSEVMKFALIVMLAYIAYHHDDFLDSGRFKKGWFKWKGLPGFLIFLVIIAVPCGLMMLQPHLSGTIIVFSIGAMIMIASSIRKRYWLAAGGLAVGGGAAAVIAMMSSGFTYFGDRFLGFFDPEADITGKTFQTYQSLVTIGSGGWFGYGLGNSRQKFAFLPASQNDFVFSIICEELGFLGGLLVMLLFTLLVIRGFYIAVHSENRFGALLAAGITAQIGIQAFLNIAVTTNAVPNTGISLPMFSYGGTALVMQMAQIGILLNISRHMRVD